MKKATQIRTKFAKVNPFTGVAVGALDIVDDEPPTDATPPGGKYVHLFATMKVGQAIRCEPDDVPRVAAALREWLRRNSLRETLRASEVTHHKAALPGTPAGRVWLLERK